MNFLVLSLSILLVIQSGLTVKLPETFKRCKVSKALDGKPNACLQEAVQDAVLKLAADNNKDLGVTRLDPLFVKSIYLERGDNSPVAIKLNFTNIKVLGLKTTKFQSISGTISSPKNFVMKLEYTLDSVALQGPYKIGGKVLILPIQGEGNSEITMYSVKGVITIHGEQAMKNGKEYLKLKDLSITIIPKKLTMNLENLFNGDKALGDNMNKFLNENWAEIYPELRSPLEKAFGNIFFEYSRRIMDRIPFSSIFITE